MTGRRTCDSRGPAKKTKARAGGAARALSEANTSGKSTSTVAQEQKAVAAMRRRSQTTDTLRALGVYQVSARIWNLRRKGYNILTELFDGVAADGLRHKRMARYTLLGEPGEASA